ncbi:DUF2237 domain-containing protein [Alishewanella sp. 16-MA]|uniref:DUF2237 domain-containing protein n=1 Tax=Alishewanella maricola TaxID=2795740 RepID=A0ABS8C5M4_9ALTE|nr:MULTISPECIES: DUF2237 domain-containing protein [Alishewanella]MCB5227633.1 DUF2237 domain-containing protein [Alishewanella maricola]MDP5207665.1 DUF2237 domain-containing protein [Alishewanella sp. SMS9]MDP5459677.1 DUF2237 domain-containing protein [Alishewanella sp. SMS8]
MDKNILGGALEACCYSPMTGYFRDGFCKTTAQDSGSHVLCGQISREFLDFTLSQGNDLTTPRPEWHFPGLQPGDFWCLCAMRWLEAEQAGVAPLLKLSACHSKALQFAELALYQQYALKE